MGKLVLIYTLLRKKKLNWLEMELKISGLFLKELKILQLIKNGMLLNLIKGFKIMLFVFNLTKSY